MPLRNPPRQRVEVASGGTLIGKRRRINFVSNATVVDDPANDEVDVTPGGGGGGGTPGGSLTELQFHDTGTTFGGDPQLTWNKTTNVLTVAGTETISSGTLTANAPALNIAQTWNNAAVPFTALKLNVTDTDSDIQSILLDLQVGGISVFSVTKPGTVFFSGTIVGSGSGLTGIAATALTGTIGDARLSANVALENAANIFTVAQVIDGTADAIQLRIQGHSTQTNPLLTLENSAGTDVLTVSNAGAVVAASFSGSGASLTALNASNVSTGTLANARTTATDVNDPDTIVLRDASGDFAANEITASTIVAGGLSGAGGNITGINATNISSGSLADARLSANVVLEDAANVFTVAQVIDGTADAIQLRIQGHSTQTNPLLTLETSAGTDVLTVSNAGAAVLLGGLTAASLTTAGALTADTLSVSGIAFDTLGEATFPAAVIAAEVYTDILSSVDEVSAIDIATPIDVTGAVTSTASFNRVGNLAVKTTMATPTNGHVLTYVAANSQWEAAASAGGGGTPGGADTNVQFNNAGAFGGEAAFAYNITTNVLTIGGGEVIASGSLTDPLLALSITQTWNDAADTFVASRTNITDTASAAASLFEDWQIAGVSVAKLDKVGGLQATNIYVDAPAATQIATYYRHGGVRRFAFYTQADGTVWNLARYNDAGAYVEDSISLARATGIVTFAQPIVGSAASMTAIPAGQLAGTVADARLTANVALEDAANTFTAAQTIAAGTITTSQPGISLTQTWNAGGVTFKAFFLNATDTASAAGSLLMELRADNVVRFSVDKAGTVNAGDILAGDVTALDVTATNLIGAGGSITGLDGTNISTGTVANARTTATAANTASTIVLRDGSNNFAAGTITATFSGNGSALTALNGTNISTGTVADARLSTNVALENAANNFTADQSFSGSTSAAIGINNGTVTSSIPLINAAQTWDDGGVTFTAIKLDVSDTTSAAGSKLIDLQVATVSQFSVNKSGTVTGVLFSGSGASLTALNGTNISTGTVADARLSSNVALENTTNTFTVAQVIDGTADAIQLTIQGHSTQTSNLLTLEQSDGTDVLTVTNAGKLKSVIRVPTIVTLTDAATIAVDASLGELFRVTLAGNRTIGNPSNPTDGQIIRIQYKQDATGTRTLTHGTSAGGYRFGTDPLTAIVLSTAASTIDEVVYEYLTAIDRWIVQSFNKGIVGT